MNHKLTIKGFSQQENSRLQRKSLYIAMLREINVGGKNKLKMVDLCESLEQLGFTNIKTYIQSGNIVFEVLETPIKALPELISHKIISDFGFLVSVIVRTPLDIKKTIENNPFLKQKNYDPSRLHVTFLSKSASKAQLEKLKETLNISKNTDQIYYAKKTIYLYCPNGYGRTKLTNSFLEKTLMVRATTRNWRTVQSLYKLTYE